MVLFIVFCSYYNCNASHILISKDKQCQIDEIYISFPIDTFSNQFLLDTIDLKINDYHFEIPNEKTVGIIIYSPDYQINFRLYIHPSDSINLFFDKTCKFSIRSKIISDPLEFGSSFKKLSKQYLVYFLFESIDSSTVFKLFEKENTKLTKVFNSDNHEVNKRYINDLLITLIGSLFRVAKLENANPKLIQMVISKYNLDISIAYSLSNYSYYYYTSYYAPDRYNINISSEYFRIHQFLFNIQSDEARQFVLGIQYIIGMKSKIPILLDEICVAYNDIIPFIDSDQKQLLNKIQLYSLFCY